MSQDLLTPLWTRRDLPDWTSVEWEGLLSQARRARLLARVAAHLSDRGWLERVPGGPRVHLDNALRVAHRQQQMVRWEVDRIRRAIGHLPTPIVLLKGAAYVGAALPPARSRTFGDVDILVEAGQLRAVEAALLEAGWSTLPLDPYDERYYRDWSHELPPLYHAGRGTFLDVHHTITQPTSRFAVQADMLLAQARTLPAEPRLSVLSPVDMVLHSAVHLMQEGDFARGQRDLLDIVDLLAHFGREPDFWPELAKRSQALRLGVPLVDVLTVAHRLLAADVPGHVQAELQDMAPRGLRNRAMAAMLTHAMRPDHPDCDRPGTRVVRWLLYVRSHLLRMRWHQVLAHLLRKAWMRRAGTAVST